MRRLAICLAVASLAALASGCPFESKVPLGTDEHSVIDQRLLGYWVWDDPVGKEESTLFTVWNFNEREYYVELSNGDKEPTRLRAYSVDVGGQAFLNISELSLDGRPQTFDFARYAFRDEGKLSLAIVGDKGIPRDLASDAEKLTEYLKSNMNDRNLYDEGSPAILRRPAPEEVEKGHLRRK
ncbi:MAG: hypothetical protein ABR899_01075 [Candidatus Krumholzibacteriaceae bacterium]